MEKMVWRLEYNPIVGILHCELISGKGYSAEPNTFNWFTICKRIEDPEMTGFCNEMDEKYLLLGKKPSVKTIQKEFNKYYAKLNNVQNAAADAMGKHYRQIPAV